MSAALLVFAMGLFSCSHDLALQPSSISATFEGGEATEILCSNQKNAVASTVRIADLQVHASSSFLIAPIKILVVGTLHHFVMLHLRDGLVSKRSRVVHD